MLKIVKKQGKIVQAYRLGNEHPVLNEQIEENKIKKVGECTYEVFSQEAVKAASGHGQLAGAGDWVRVDGAGFPYPCKNEWFQENLRHVAGDDYEQIPKVLSAWTADQEICPEVKFLIQKKGLVLDDENPDIETALSFIENNKLNDEYHNDVKRVLKQAFENITSNF